MTELSIPVIDVAALFAGPSGERDRTDSLYWRRTALPGCRPAISAVSGLMCRRRKTCWR